MYLMPELIIYYTHRVSTIVLNVTAIPYELNFYNNDMHILIDHYRVTSYNIDVIFNLIAQEIIQTNKWSENGKHYNPRVDHF